MFEVQFLYQPIVVLFQGSFAFSKQGEKKKQWFLMIENQVQSVHAVQVTNSLRGIKIYQPSSPKRHLRDEVLLKARGTGTKLKEPAITTSQCWCAPCLQPSGSQQSAPKITLTFSLLLVRQVTKLHSFHLFFFAKLCFKSFCQQEENFSA